MWSMCSCVTKEHQCTLPVVASDRYAHIHRHALVTE
jgi:hypothetical protein